MPQWVWVGNEEAFAAHSEQIAENGGSDGIRDTGLFESAMARPRNLAVYEPDAASLAAAYAYGLARNHAFVDGNKRTATVVSEGFLNLNGYSLMATDAEIVIIFETLAAGDLAEEDLASWFREHLTGP